MALPAYWRVFYTRARAEKKCEQRLRDLQFEVFLPKRSVVRKWKDRTRSVNVPLFPNYIFACLDERERLQVLHVAGIVRCISLGDGPVVVREEEIGQMKLMQKKPGWLEPLDIPLPAAGSDVVIERGVLRGLKGRVVERRGRVHLVVRVASIKQSVRVVVPAEDVAAA